MPDRPKVARGRSRTIVCAIRRSGDSPARDYLDALDRRYAVRFEALFQNMVESGRCGSEQAFKKVSGSIWEFKRAQHRIACYQDGKYLILLHGFQKKQDRWPKQELARAERIMREDQELGRPQN